MLGKGNSYCIFRCFPVSFFLSGSFPSLSLLRSLVLIFCPALCVTVCFWEYRLFIMVYRVRVVGVDVGVGVASSSSSSSSSILRRLRLRLRDSAAPFPVFWTGTSALR